MKSGSDSEIVVFPNVKHGLNIDDLPTFDQSAATGASKSTRDWLKEHGV